MSVIWDAQLTWIADRPAEVDPPEGCRWASSRDGHIPQHLCCWRPVSVVTGLFWDSMMWTRPAVALED